MKKEDIWYDPRKETLAYSQQTYLNPWIEENLDEQASRINGWTPQRTMRKIGSIPPIVFQKWWKTVDGDQMDRLSLQAELTKFLNDHPEFRTVENIKSDVPNDTHILVK